MDKYIPGPAASEKDPNAKHVYQSNSSGYTYHNIFEPVPLTEIPEFTSEAHYQLRDCIFSWKEYTFFAQRAIIRCLNRNTKEVRTIFDTYQDNSAATIPSPSVSVKCYSQAHQDGTAQCDCVPKKIAWNGWHVSTLKVFLDQYLVVGGKGGEIVLLDVNDNFKVLKGTRLAGFMNNFVELQKYKDEYRIVVCNNRREYTLQVYTFPEFKEIKIKKMATLINAVGLSPDGKWMVAAGDAPVLFVFDVSEGKYHMAREISKQSGSNSISWNHSSTMFAVASNGGNGAVYSVPDCNNCWKMRPAYFFWQQGLEEDSVNQPPTQISVARFNPSPTIGDMLVFTEELNYVHILDLTQKRRQVLRVPERKRTKQADSTEESQEEPPRYINGVAFSRCGRRLYIGTSSRIPDTSAMFEFYMPEVRSLKSICIARIQQNIHNWPQNFEWNIHLPAELAQELLEPFGHKMPPAPLPTNQVGQIEVVDQVERLSEVLNRFLARICKQCGKIHGSADADADSESYSESDADSDSYSDSDSDSD